MSFFDAFTNDRAELALKRTNKDLESGWQYASTHKLEAVLAVGSLVAFMVFMPAFTMLALAVSALALLSLNLFTPPSASDSVGHFLRGQ